MHGRLVGHFGRWVLPIVRRLDSGFDTGVLGEEVDQVGTGEELEGFAVGELEACLAVAAGGDEDAFGGTFVLHGAVQVPHGADADGVLIPLGLDDDLAAEDGSRVVRDAVDSAVAAGLGESGFEAHLLEKVGDELFELARREFHEVRPLVEGAEQVRLVDEAGVDHVELEYRPDGTEVCGTFGHRCVQSLEARNRVDAGKVDPGEGVAAGAYGDKAGVFGVSGAGVDGVDVAVEHDGVDVAPPVCGEDLS